MADGSGGSARVTLNGLQNFQVQASRLTLAGQPVQGTLSAAGGLLTAAWIARAVQSHGYSPVFYGLCTLHPLAAVLLWWRVGSRPNREEAV